MKGDIAKDRGRQLFETLGWRLRSPNLDGVGLTMGLGVVLNDDVLKTADAEGCISETS